VTYQANADAWLQQSSPSNNYGSDSILKVKSQGTNDNFRAVVKFNVPTTLPAGCVVESATLRVHSPSATNGRTLQALRLNGSWTEGGINWSNQPATAGTAATATSGTGYREWLVTAQVQDSFTAGNHHGFLIRDAAEGASGFEQQFTSRSSSTNKPLLVVRYTQAP
jgi:hypothetical protein